MPVSPTDSTKYRLKERKFLTVRSGIKGAKHETEKAEAKRGRIKERKSDPARLFERG
jgi:hypothetical protein